MPALALMSIVGVGLFASAASAKAPGAADPLIGGAPPTYLPSLGCAPADNESDDAAHAFQPADAHVFKLVYAHAADAPDQLAQVYPSLEGAVRDQMEFVYLESEGRKSLRFDLGTASGPGCVDVQRVSLPHPAGYYDPTNVSKARELVVADLEPRLGAQPGPRNYLVFADGVPNQMRSANTSPTPLDDSPQGPSWAPGGFFAVVFDNPFSFPLGVALAKVGTHELFHELGAVQPSAPHYGGGGHCADDHADLMCRREPGDPHVCSERDYTTTSVIAPLDCNRDDYFNPSPAPSSYLATHWNTYNSLFLCDMGTCAPDNVGPQVTIRGRHRIRKKRARFRLSADESVSGFICLLDKRAARPCSPRFTTPRLKRGRHLLRVSAADLLGNPSSEAARFRFRVIPRKRPVARRTR